MDKIDHPYAVMIERLHVLDRSIHVLNLVNNDLRQILHKQKPLPQFIRDSLKRSTTSKPKTSTVVPVAPPPPPKETEEMRLAASIIDKARRTIENVGEKKSRQSSAMLASVSTAVQLNTVHASRPKTASSTRPSSASSTVPSPLNPSVPQQQPPQQPVRRYVPAHVKAPFLTQPEKKRRPSSSVRNSIQTNPDRRTSATQRSTSQQRRLSTTTQSTAEVVEQVTQVSPISSTQTKTHSTAMDDRTISGPIRQTDLPDVVPVNTTTGEPVAMSGETVEIDDTDESSPIILNRALIKPLRRLWKQNHLLRSRLKRELEKRSTPSPPFIERLNEQIYSSRNAEEVHVPNVEVVLQLAVKLRAIVLHLLETPTFDDLENALKRLSTLKYLVNQYQLFFISNTHILVAKQHQRPSNTNINIGEWSQKRKSSQMTRNIIRYSDDSQLIAFTEVRFKQFENECRWIELNWHEQMIVQFKQTISNSHSNPLQVYRELMSLVTGLQASTPIVVENRIE